MKFKILGLAVLLTVSVPAGAATRSLDFLTQDPTRSVIVGGWEFTDWRVTTNFRRIGTAVGAADLSNIDVTDTNIVGPVVQLRFDLNGEMRIDTVPPQDSEQALTIEYTACFLGCDDQGQTLGSTSIETTFDSDVDVNDNTGIGGFLQADSRVEDANGINPLQLETFLNTRALGNPEDTSESGDFTGVIEPLAVITELRMDIDGGGTYFHEIQSLTQNFQPVPIPAAAWLLGSGLVALGAVARRRRMTA